MELAFLVVDLHLVPGSMRKGWYLVELPLRMPAIVEAAMMMMMRTTFLSILLLGRLRTCPLARNKWFHKVYELRVSILPSYVV